ncbi:uncharacterized protein LOC126744545 [Anthonomus grandis grandis]|uniref:uncharacterized protein LOC126744545 n=1 Tax=Anthonomus grandis grandis TaxID=2921223 RepID=UPI0021660F78|nr:uncharacterized protein LOC126744545 [Anthonomus grandis grandis]
MKLRLLFIWAKESDTKESKMIYLVCSIVLFGGVAVSSQQHQQEINLPAFNDFSPPEEVNGYLNANPKVQRSFEVGSGRSEEDAIQEVERLIEADPGLPRLTRGEILDILDNITKQDERNLLDSISQDSFRDPKALMVVKAYTPLGSGEVNVEEFYTKPPIISIVDSEEDFQTAKPVGPSSTTTSKSSIRRNPVKTSQEKKPYGGSTKKPYRGNTVFKSRTTAATTEPTTHDYTKPTVNYREPSETPKRRRQRISTTTTTTTQLPATTYRPRRRPPVRKEPKYPNHKYPGDLPSRYPPEGIRIVRPPAIRQSPSELNAELEDLLPQEVETQETVVEVPGSTRRPPGSSEMHFGSLSEPSIELEIPDHLKKVVADLNLAAIKDSTNQINAVLPPPHLNKNEAEKAEEVLASIGGPFLPPRSAAPNANVMADNLSPDMQKLLKSFGLLPDDHKTNKTVDIPDFNPEKAEIHPESYVGFKPLPEDSESSKNMEEFLAQFGLISNRDGKSLKKGKSLLPNVDPKNVKIEQISLDTVPDDLKPLLQEMGFGVRGSRKIREQPSGNSAEASSDEKTPGFGGKVDPGEEYVPEEDVKKLGRLVEILKKLEQINGTITEDDMAQADKQELKELITSLNRAAQEEKNPVPLSEQLGPNPHEFDFGLKKNEIKRQEGAAGTTTEETVETVTAESLPEETKTPSIKDLEDSFGGATEPSTTESVPDPTTTRRSGVYYLLDWNTFFEIDDQKGKRVNLRLQPKVGDPKRFYSVNVP